MENHWEARRSGEEHNRIYVHWEAGVGRRPYCVHKGSPTEREAR